jgi:hypothetical protein
MPMRRTTSCSRRRYKRIRSIGERSQGRRAASISASEVFDGCGVFVSSYEIVVTHAARRFDT